MSNFKIHFQLQNLDKVSLWGTYPQQSIHWFGLTDGLLWIDVCGQTIYEYTDEAYSYFDNHSKYNDYRLSRFMEDFSGTFLSVGEYGGIPGVLYVLSGNDIDPDDPFGNTDEDDKQLVAQSYLISSDAGAPNLEDFFEFIEDIKTTRRLNFTIDEETFSDDDCIVEWLAELSS